MSKDASHSAEAVAADAVAWLKRNGSKRVRDGMARYAIPSDHAFGVPVSGIRDLGRRIGRNHEAAHALWKTGWYEARMLTAFVADPKQLTVAEMEAWCRDFEDWAICDTLCFHLFDKSPLAWGRVTAWSRRRPEFEKRAAFALLASLAGHDKTSPDERFAAMLPLIERGASDDRNFVKKGVSWALRGIGRRRGVRAACIELAQRLVDDGNDAARWVGRDALRDLQKRK